MGVNISTYVCIYHKERLFMSPPPQKKSCICNWFDGTGPRQSSGIFAMYLSHHLTSQLHPPSPDGRARGEGLRLMGRVRLTVVPVNMSGESIGRLGHGSAGHMRQMGQTHFWLIFFEKWKCITRTFLFSLSQNELLWCGRSFSVTHRASARVCREVSWIEIRFTRSCCGEAGSVRMEPFQSMYLIFKWAF